VRFFSVSLRLAPLLVALLTSGCPEAKEAEPKVPAAAAKVDAAPKKAQGKHAGQSLEEISYADSNDGLDRLMKDLKTAILADDEPEMAILLASLRLEDDETFLKSTFGDALGATLSAQYKPHREEIGVLATHLKEKFESGLRNIEAFSFSQREMQTATGYQNAALDKMKVRRTLYSVRLSNTDKTETFHLWSFVHFEGSFRYIGKLKGVAGKNSKGGRDLNELRKSDAERLIAQEK
jgi:hypothetical protein